MKNDDAFSNLSEMECFIFASLSLSRDILDQGFSFGNGDFSKFGLVGINNLNDLLSAIDSHSEVVEGIGLEKYRTKLLRSIGSVAASGEEATIFLSLLWQGIRLDALMHIGRKGTELLFTFIKIKNPDDLPGVESLVSGSFKDKLTGLFNFQTLYKHLSESDKHCLLCLFDLNGFKAINDSFGHAVGDDVLVLITSYLISISTQNEIYYRRSGDEFFIFFLNGDLNHAKNLIEKIEFYIESLGRFNFSNLEGFQCSAAFGMVELRDDLEDGRISPEDELKLADYAMYEAKHQKKSLRFIDHDEAKRIIEDGKLEDLLSQAAKKCAR